YMGAAVWASAAAPKGAQRKPRREVIRSIVSFALLTCRRTVVTIRLYRRNNWCDAHSIVCFLLLAHAFSAAGQPVSKEILGLVSNTTGAVMNHWFDTNAFVRSKCDRCAGAGRFMSGTLGYGNAGVELFDAPAPKTWDFALFKDFQIREGHRL